jgi:hypothetical protein
LGLIWLTGRTFNNFYDSSQKIHELQRQVDMLETDLKSADPAKTALQQYFTYLKNRDYVNAYKIVSSARISQRKAKFGQNDFEEFQSSFNHTYAYDDFSFGLKPSNGGDRKYTVSYDVTDDVPRNDLFDNRTQLLSSTFFAKIFNRDEIIKLIFINLQRYYVVSGDATIQMIKTYVDSRMVQELMDPLFIASLVSDLKDLYNVSLPNRPGPQSKKVRRHFLHEVTMVQENDGWKILTGLDMALVFNYDN